MPDTDEKRHDEGNSQLNQIPQTPQRTPLSVAMRSVQTFIRRAFLAAVTTLPFVGHDAPPVNTQPAFAQRTVNANTTMVQTEDAPCSLSETEEELLMSVNTDAAAPENLTIVRAAKSFVAHLDGKEYVGTLSDKEHMTTFTIDERTISFQPAVGKEDIRLVVWNVIQSFRQIAKREDLHIDRKTRFDGIGGRRIQFSVEQNGKNIAYIATPRDVLRLTDEEPLTTQELKELYDVRASIKRLIQTKKYSEVPRGGLKWDVVLSNFDRNEREQERQKILEGMEEMRSLERKQEPLSHRQGSRVLINDRNQQKIYEKHAPEHPGSYERVYSKLKDLPEVRESYLHDQLYWRSIHHSNKTISLYIPPENGAKHHSVYDALGEPVMGKRVRADGKLLSIWREKNQDMYAPSGELSYRIHEDKEFNKRIHLYDGKEKKFYDPLVIPIAELRTKIDTPEKYYIWEEQRYSDHTMTDKRFGQMREIGKAICGVDSLLQKIHKMHEDQISIEVDWAPHGTTFGVADMRSLQKNLPIVEKALQQYPAGYQQRIGLQRMTLVTGSDIRDGGFRSVEGFNEHGSILFTLRKSEELPKLIHHELFHQLERELDTMQATNTYWWMSRSAKTKEPSLRDDDFARNYGMTNATEDKATMAEDLMVSREGRILRERAKENRILAEKIRYIEQMYYIASNGKMDRTYWNDVLAGTTINRSYWQKRERESSFTKDPEAEKMLQSFNLKRSVFQERDRIVASMEGTKRGHALAELFLDAIRKDQQWFYYRELHNMKYNGLLSKNDELAYLAKATAVAPEQTPFFIWSLLHEEYLRAGRKDDARHLLQMMRDGSPAYREHAVEWLQKMDEREKK